MSWNYATNLVRTHRVLLLASAGFVAAFQALILMLMETFDLPAILQEVFRQLPFPAQQLFGDQLISQYAEGGAVALGYSHPLVLVTLLLVAISIPVRHLAGAVESGTLELVFTMPVPRIQVAASLWTGSGFFLAVLVVGCWAGTGVGLLIFPEARDLSLAAVARLGLNLWLLSFAISSYALLISSHAREASRAAQLAAGLTLLFYFLHYAVQIWTALDFLQPMTPFYYYSPQELMRDGSRLFRDAAVLALFAIVTGVGAVRRIHRRDIP